MRRHCMTTDTADRHGLPICLVNNIAVDDWKSSMHKAVGVCAKLVGASHPGYVSKEHDQSTRRLATAPGLVISTCRGLNAQS